jgi:hypothetical protein
LGALSCLGAFSIQLRIPAPQPDIARFTDGTEVTLTGHVIREGNFREAGLGGLRQTLDVENEQVATDSDMVSATFGLRVSLYVQGAPAGIRPTRDPGRP